MEDPCLFLAQVCRTVKHLSGSMCKLIGSELYLCLLDWLVYRQGEFTSIYGFILRVLTGAQFKAWS